ncbi:MAG: N-6 DNA methylase, partial [Chloroflexi bacterium]|nr:N-6 DNA methylase [Chloroflexota bacterium]
ARNDKRCEHRVPPVGNVNFAWVQHMILHLAPAGLAGFVLANGSISSNQSGEGEIRKNMVEADSGTARPGCRAVPVGATNGR